tara:strand:+ start:174 stop:818 length:645 start_codon:yes stop_codon:yes gene_type:complete
MNIVVINYNSGNLASLTNSLENVVKKNNKAYNILISDKPEKVMKADKVILPGVGDFYNCKKQLLNIDGMNEALNDYIKKKCRPFLGICIGMHLMANVSHERGTNKGLELVNAEVTLIEKEKEKIRVPHMGWNDISLENKKYTTQFSSLNKNDFYFVHSYHMSCKNKDEILAYVNYGKKLVAAICKDNILGVQFHPEKSQTMGQRFLQEFLNWKP